MKKILVLAIASMLLGTLVAGAAFAASKSNRILISYVPPKSSALKPVYKDLKDRRVLEKLQQFLSPFRLPRPLKIMLTGCKGEDDAYYGDDVITVCYEYVAKLKKNMPKKATPAGITPMDTVIGPFFNTALHEFAHALFDMLNLQTFGRTEDVADQVAAYIQLQLGKDEARRLIMGTAYGFFADSKTDDSPQTRKEFFEDFSEVHSMPIQRLYNVLCLAYGADEKQFGDFVTKGYLPKERAELCAEEYEQVQDAFDFLIKPHLDVALAKKVLARTWIRKTTRTRKNTTRRLHKRRSGRTNQTK